MGLSKRAEVIDQAFLDAEYQLSFGNTRKGSSSCLTCIKGDIA